MYQLHIRERCPACETSRYKIVYSCDFLHDPVVQFIKSKFVGGEIFSYLEGYSYTLVECLSCGLIYQTNIPSAEFASRIYNDWLNNDSMQEMIDHGGKQISLLMAGNYLQDTAKVLSYIAALPHEIDMLDYGMGWGRWCLAGKALGCNVYGFDLSDVRNEYARSNGIALVDGATLGGRYYDYINTEQVLEHVQNPLEMTRFLAGALKPGGILKISVPDGSHVKRGIENIRWGDGRRWSGFRKFLMPITPLIHINTFSPHSIRVMAQSAGLEEVGIPLRHDFALVPMLSVREALRNTLRPIYRKLVPTTRLFFRKPGL